MRHCKVRSILTMNINSWKLRGLRGKPRNLEGLQMNILQNFYILHRSFLLH